MKTPIRLWAWVSVDEDGTCTICRRGGHYLTSFRKEELDKPTIEAELRWQAARARTTVHLMRFAQVDTTRIIPPPTGPVAVPPRPRALSVNYDMVRRQLLRLYGKQRQKLRTTVILVTAIELAACGGAPGLPVARADYGDRWPFTIERGTVRCTRDSPQSSRLLVTLDTGTGIQFGLNGAAIAFGFPDVADALQPGKTGADVQPFIDLGVPLCQ
jgi:Protein of unknown function (DUF2511)